jgi:hypothetical protein
MDLSPQHASYTAQSNRYRIKKSPRWDDDHAVAATVGTIMALLVFLAFMGIFTSQFVPAWMNDNESTHMSQAIGQFTTLKSQIDIGISNSQNSLIAPTPIFVPITLSAVGIPVFASATAGIMSFVPESLTMRPMFNVTYTYESATTGVELTLSSSNDGRAGGSLDLYCPNRYYVEEHLIYENGAVILNQSDGEFIIAGAQFAVKNVGTQQSPSRVVMMTQVSMQGDNKTVGGTGSKGVNADIAYASTNVYDNEDKSTLTITMTTQHGVAWKNFFLRMLNGSSNMTFGNGFNITETEFHFSNNLLDYSILTVTIDNVSTLDFTKAYVRIAIGELSA